MAARPYETQPGTLLITMTIPPHRINKSQNGEIDYLPYLPFDFDLQNYEVACAHGFGSEEFDWGLYWYKNPNEGIWFTLQKVPQPAAAAAANPMMPRENHPLALPTGVPPSYTVVRYSATLNQLRLSSSVVGLIRLLTVPPEADFADESGGAMLEYIEWLTTNLATTSSRTCLWAVGTFVRCRLHVARIHELGELPAFDLTVFLREVLTFAYAEVWYALGGQLPRPTLISTFGSGLVLVLPETNVNEAQAQAQDNHDGTQAVEGNLNTETGAPQEEQQEEWPALPTAQN